MFWRKSTLNVNKQLKKKYKNKYFRNILFNLSCSSEAFFGSFVIVFIVTIKGLHKKRNYYQKNRNHDKTNFTISMVC